MDADVNFTRRAHRARRGAADRFAQHAPGDERRRAVPGPAALRPGRRPRCDSTITLDGSRTPMQGMLEAERAPPQAEAAVSHVSQPMRTSFGEINGDADAHRPGQFGGRPARQRRWRAEAADERRRDQQDAAGNRRASTSATSSSASCSATRR